MEDNLEENKNIDILTSEIERIKQPMPKKEEIIEYYSRDYILEELLKIAKDREFVGAFSNGAYSKRPNIVQYYSDIIHMVENGITSFHCSVERWKNPMMLSTDKRNYNELRSGFDFLIDIDSKIGIEAAKICASLVCKLLESYGIKSYGIKFSGSRGFHIIVPFEAFPEEVNYEKIANQYPRIPRILSEFIREKIKDELLEKLVEKYSLKKLFEFLPTEKLDAFVWVDVEKGWGDRHLFRAPFSINEKTWLISIPIRSLDEFDIEKAKISNVKKFTNFLKECNEKEAINLLIDALEWSAKIEKSTLIVKKEKKQKSDEIFMKKVPEGLFPPCIKNILRGLQDGKKRSTFTLISFLRMMNWSKEEIEAKLDEWNRRNIPSLSSSFINSQLNWHFRQERIFPSNCESDLFYKSIGICTPDEICKEIKNPMNYPMKIIKMGKREEETSLKESYICKICNRSFKNEKGLKMHQIKYHKDSLL
ncbi:MAG: DNA primase small subunit domain-containing protein [Candidatus Aenigmatarchaeota archaeon]